MGLMGDGMAKVKLPYVEFKQDRHGVLRYCYFRHNEQRWTLPTPPMSEEFFERYRELVALIKLEEPSPSGGGTCRIGATSGRARSAP